MSGKKVGVCRKQKGVSRKREGVFNLGARDAVVGVISREVRVCKVLSHTKYLFKSLKTSTPPQNRELTVYLLQIETII